MKHDRSMNYINQLQTFACQFCSMHKPLLVSHGQTLYSAGCYCLQHKCPLIRDQTLHSAGCYRLQYKRPLILQVITPCMEEGLAM